MSETTNDIENILNILGFSELNPMQKTAIEAIHEHDNVQLLAATGSGKTLAFLIPILKSLQADIKVPQALIIVPSRELALQIEKVFKSMRTTIKITCCYGGHKREIEENELVDPPLVIVGTPGRLGDHIRRNNFSTEHIRFLVLDEFDKSLELGFQEEVQFITDGLKNVKKQMLTSATDAIDIPEFIKWKNPKLVNFLLEESQPKALTIQKATSDKKDKVEFLLQLICQIGARPTIIFCNHRESVERLSYHLWEKGVINEYYHGAMDQREREAALAKFRNGSTQFLITTDLAARGLDIAHIRYIIHYHLPLTEDAFIHRNGRTARMDASGTAILILGPDEEFPEYLDEATVEEVQWNPPFELPEKPKWVSLYIPLGKKNKVNKTDVVGFLTNVGALKPDEIGIIEVKDFHIFVAIRKSKATHTFHLIKDGLIKGKKAKAEIVKQQFRTNREFL
ncbi:MAG TPA: DEAD/DEAH box helicase [Edaphocola sp.]|nr:DEAD/DEAH box helicase [Edaphocola sp.]